MNPCRLPQDVLTKALRAHIKETLPHLRQTAVPPQRHTALTLLMYWFPADETWDPCEFALRQSWAVLGRLPTVLVTQRLFPALNDFARREHVEVQLEPSLTPGKISTMSADCIARLWTRFTTRHVLIVQADGWPLRDELNRFLAYDYVGAPNVQAGWRGRVADLLGLTVLNGGFSLRSRSCCRAAARSWAWKRFFCRSIPSEDHFYSHMLWQRKAPAHVARLFSLDDLESNVPVAPGSSPMGFHRATTFRVLTEPARLTVVSVVRDEACYERCLRHNEQLKGARWVTFDNTRENLPIPVRYNAFLETMPEDTAWILFAHEDFELREDPCPQLASCNPLFPYGLIGTRKVLGTFILPFGALEDSNRDGSLRHQNRPPLPYEAVLGNMVENFDCCGFFVHRDFFKTWGLRFDPRCAWDLYAEDLCFQFILKTQHLARVLPLKAHHWSRGDAKCQRFAETLAVLNAKYPDSLFAGGTCTLCVGGLPPLKIRLYRWLVHHLMPWRFS